jgi:hypothetical protein
LELQKGKQLVVRPARPKASGRKGMAETTNVPSSDPLVESGEGSASSDTESLVRHILEQPEVSSAPSSHERTGGKVSPVSLAGPLP